MNIMEKIFHLISGGLEFLEVSVIVNENFNLEKLRKSCKAFSTFNGIDIIIVKKLPKFVIGKTIFIEYNENKKRVNLKALHAYYDGISISKFMKDLDIIYNGGNLTKKFYFKTITENKILQRCLEFGTNLIMNKMEDETPKKESEPLYVFKNKKSGDIIREIQKRENKDMILIVANNKLEKTNSEYELGNKLQFKYVKKGQDFKDALKDNKIRILDYIRGFKNKEEILFVNNIANIELPSFVEKLTPTEVDNNIQLGQVKLVPIIIYPTMENGINEVYRV